MKTNFSVVTVAVHINDNALSLQLKHESKGLVLLYIVVGSSGISPSVNANSGVSIAIHFSFLFGFVGFIL